jgi:hypothetical protein
LISSSQNKGALVGAGAGAALGGGGAAIAVLYCGATLGPLGIAGAALACLVLGSIAGGYKGRCNGISASEAYID